MTRKWIKTQFPGVRYRQHPTRKHGVKFDQFFTIRYKLSGRDAEEAIGWASEGHTAGSAYEALAELRRNHKTGNGPRTLAEKRALEDQARMDAEATKAIEDAKNISWGSVWAMYTEHAAVNKSATSARTEKIMERLWISQAIDSGTPLRSISPFHLEKIKSVMTKANRAPRTIAFTLGTVRAVFNYAKRHDLFSGDNPVSKVKLPTADNRRLRFLTRDEAFLLLAKLKEKSADIHDKALLSLHAGLRLGEINSLTWADVDLDRKFLTLRDTKNGRTRAAFMTEQAKAMIEGRRPETIAPTDLVFPSRRDKKSVWTSATFARTVKELGFNEGITDTRQKVVFHSLRHTFASWLAENGTDLYVVKELLGHSDFRMTQRYSHLGKNTMQTAVDKLGRIMAEQVEQLEEQQTAKG